MTARIVPSRCPRCERPFDPALLSADASGLATAGCACGEVTRVFFDDPDEPPLAPPVVPPDWTEHARVGGWSATLGKRNEKEPARSRLPRREHVNQAIAVGLMLPILVLQAFRTAPLGFVLGGTYGMYVLALVTPLLPFAYLVWMARQNAGPWTYVIEGSQLRIANRRLRHDVPLEAVVRFSAHPRSTQYGTFYELRVVLRDRAPIVVPLGDRSAANAQFVADRLNAVLATEGRGEETGYRGEVRIAVEDEPALEEEPASEGILEPVRRALRR